MGSPRTIRFGGFVVFVPGYSCGLVASGEGKERFARLLWWDHPAFGMGSGFVVVADEGIDLGSKFVTARFSRIEPRLAYDGAVGGVIN